MKTYKEFISTELIAEASNADDLKSNVDVLLKNLKAAEKHTRFVGKTTRVLQDEKGRPYLQKARQAAKDIQTALSKLDNEWNGILR